MASNPTNQWFYLFYIYGGAAGKKHDYRVTINYFVRLFGVHAIDTN